MSEAVGNCETNFAKSYSARQSISIWTGMWTNKINEIGWIPLEKWPTHAEKLNFSFHKLVGAVGNWSSEAVGNHDSNFHWKSVFSKEIYFYMTGYLNKHDYRIWSNTNPQGIQKRLKHSDKFSVWCHCCLVVGILVIV